MAFPPKPPPLTTHPEGKPGIPDHLVENARRAMAMARAETELSIRMQRVIHRMMSELQPAGAAPPERQYRWLAGARA